MEERPIISPRHFSIIIERLCQQLIEDYEDFENAAIVGVQARGAVLAERIHGRLEAITSHAIEFGKLDITFFRDDFRTRIDPIQANKTEINFSLEGKRIVLIDDVLYRGRTVQAALAALNHFGRPEAVRLLVLVDRRFNRQVPIKPDYVGQSVDAYDKAYVKVEMTEEGGTDRVLLFPEGRS